MKTLFALSGLPFSGKSTLLKSISENTDIVTISFDNVWQELEKSTKNLTYESVTELIDRDISNLLSRGKSVAYDSLNDTPDQRERLRSIANRNDAEFRVIYLSTPIEIIKGRRDGNIKMKLRHTVSEDKLEESILKFVPPSDNEETLVFNPEDNPIQWIKDNVSSS
ncbi:ATP-binding protein [Candidatus Dojkabacteria bacterium]|nr:ATP-binding protein [Candidatus Dojkabacteria bacterium]